MNIVIQRTVFSDQSTIGQLMIDDRFFCYTLEDADRKLEDGNEKIHGKSAIPRGAYFLTIDHSNKYKRDMPHILDVPGFKGIRIHSGNRPEDSEGCILVGSDYSDDWISNSRSTYDKLFTRLKHTIKAGESITIEVT